MDRVAIAVVMANKQFLQDMQLVGRPAMTGLLMSIFLLAYAVSQFFWGYFVKRFGPRIAAITGALIWAGSMGLSGLAESAGALIAARFILGAGEGFLFATCNTYVINWFPPKERATASSMWMNGQTLGNVAAGIVVVSLIAAGGWRMSFFIIAALSIIIPLPPLLFLMKDRPRQLRLISSEEVKIIEEAAPVKEETKAVGMGSFLRNYRFWLITGAWAGNSMYYFGWATWMPTYFQNVRHFSFQAAGYLYSLNWIVIFLVVLGTGYFSDRFMRRAPFGGLGYLLSGAAMFVGGLVISNNYASVAVLVIALCGHQMGFLMVHALYQSVMPRASVSQAVGTGGMIATFAGMTSPTLVGYLLQISGFDAVIVSLAFVIIGAAICLLILVREGH
jgi:sugar phosphate permease